MATAGIRGEINMRNDPSGVNAAIADARRFRQEFESLNRAGSAAAGGIGKSRGGAGMAFLEFSRAVEDAQYGIRGVLNNIPQMALAMGAGAGLTGVVSILAVGFATLGQKAWDWANRTKDVGEATEFLKRKTTELNDALKQSEKEAADGTEEGKERMARAAYSAADAFEYQASILQRNIEVTKAKADADKALALAKVTETGEAGILKRLEIEERYAKESEAFEVGALERKRELNRQRVNEAERLAEDLRIKAEEAKRFAEDEVFINPQAEQMARTNATATKVDADRQSKIAMEAKSREFAEDQAIEGRIRAIESTAETRRETARVNAENARQEARKAREQDAKDQQDKDRDWLDSVNETYAKEAEIEGKREEARQKERNAIAAKVAINQARERGDEREAAALEHKVRILERIRQLEDLGFDPQEAASLAEMEAGPEERRIGRNGRRRIGRPGRGKIGASGIDDRSGWALDQRARGSLRDELDNRIGSVGDRDPKRPSRVTRERESGSKNETADDQRKTREVLEKILAAIEPVAKKERSKPMSSGGDRNYFGLP